MEHLETAAAGATAPPPQTATDIQLSGGITRESAAVDCDGDGGGDE